MVGKACAGFIVYGLLNPDMLAWPHRLVRLFHLRYLQLTFKLTAVH